MASVVFEDSNEKMKTRSEVNEPMPRMTRVLSVPTPEVRGKAAIGRGRIGSGASGAIANSISDEVTNGLVLEPRLDVDRSHR